MTSKQMEQKLMIVLEIKFHQTWVSNCTLGESLMAKGVEDTTKYQRKHTIRNISRI